MLSPCGVFSFTLENPGDPLPQFTFTSPVLGQGHTSPQLSASLWPSHLPWSPPPSLAGLGQVLGVFVRPERELLQMSPVAAVTLGELSGWVQGEGQNRCNCQGGRASRATGTETPFLHRAQAAGCPKVSFQHSAVPPAEPAPDRLHPQLLSGAQPPHPVAVGQEEQDPQGLVCAMGHALEHYFCVKTNTNSSRTRTPNSCSWEYIG